MSDSHADILKDYPEYFDVNGRRYVIEGVDDDGKLIFSSKNISVDVRDIQKIIQEAIDSGVLADVKENPNSSLRRCEAIFEMWRSYSDLQRFSFEDSGEGIPDYVVQASQLCSEAYYREAVAWFLGTGKDYVKDLYNFRDLEGPITWFELAYILYVAFGLSDRRTWSKIPIKGVKVSKVTNEINGRERLVYRLSAYKQPQWMKTYLKNIQQGINYIPLPVYCALTDMVNDGIVPVSSVKLVGGELKAVGTDIKSDGDLSWCLREVSKQDMLSVIEKTKSRF